MGAFGFLAPWLLVGLIALPVIWLILRLTPPRPRQVDFPPTRLLFDIDDRERTPARTPWWLTALRLMLTALIILALAEPILRPEATVTAGSGPLLVVLDNSWDAAPDFAQRMAVAEAAIDEAGRASRPVSVVATAEPRAQSLAAEPADAARRRLAAIVPQPYLPDRAPLAARLQGSFAPASTETLWIAGALDGGGGDAFGAVLDGISAGGAVLQSARPLTVMRSPTNGADGVSIPLTRIGGAGGGATVAGFDQAGRRILEAEATFGADGTGTAEVDLPTEIRNALVRVSVTGEPSAGAVQLLDARWQRKSVGLVSGEGEAAQPLLEPLTYVQRALAPTTDIIAGDAPSTSEAIAALIARGASIIVLTDIGSLPPDTTATLVQWVEDGGTLLRFASPNLAATTVDELLPLRLRQGERALGGSLSWEEPQPIGRFTPAGPFGNIPVPADVAVTRQVLADPDSLRDAQVWAELRDGTPLVTAAQRGRGRIVLFHVTADPRWSNLPLSGAFVSMLNAIVDTAGIVQHQAQPAQAGAPAAAPWKPVEILDGTGSLGAPPPGATLVADIETTRPGAETPPGIYDRDGTLRALNAVDAATTLTPLVPAALGWRGRVGSLEPSPSQPVWPYLLAAAAILAILDGLAVLALSGRMSRRLARDAGSAAAATLVAMLLLVQGGDRAAAQDEDTAKAVRATTRTEIAYVLTNNAEIDATSKAGLTGLSTYLADRTALEPGDPEPVDPATDELAFYSLIYWPIDPAQPTPSPATMAKVDTFMKNGGTILFDTRDAGGSGGGFGGDTPESTKLRDILAYVDVPPLEPVPPDHVLTKAFYLLSEFPGRWDGSELWVESLGDQPAGERTRPARGGDGVSPILITGNDFAAAWAVDADGLWLYPTVPADQRQRELAFRAGVNIVMYSLTGNYKADQVHVPALLERLGQ